MENEDGQCFQSELVRCLIRAKSRRQGTFPKKPLENAVIGASVTDAKSTIMQKLDISVTRIFLNNCLKQGTLQSDLPRRNCRSLPVQRPSFPEVSKVTLR